MVWFIFCIVVFVLLIILALLFASWVFMYLEKDWAGLAIIAFVFAAFSTGMAIAMFVQIQKAYLVAYPG